MLKTLNNNIAEAWSGYVITKDIEDLLSPPPEETRTKEEIVNTIFSKIDKIRNTNNERI